jgi:hypothetical protein
LISSLEINKATQYNIIEGFLEKFRSCVQKENENETHSLRKADNYKYE